MLGGLGLFKTLSTRTLGSGWVTLGNPQYPPPLFGAPFVQYLASHYFSDLWDHCIILKHFSFLPLGRNQKGISEVLIIRDCDPKFSRVSQSPGQNDSGYLGNRDARTHFIRYRSCRNCCSNCRNLHALHIWRIGGEVCAGVHSHTTLLGMFMW